MRSSVSSSVVLALASVLLACGSSRAIPARPEATSAGGTDVADGGEAVDGDALERALRGGADGTYAVSSIAKARPSSSSVPIDAGTAADEPRP